MKKLIIFLIIIQTILLSLGIMHIFNGNTHIGLFLVILNLIGLIMNINNILDR